MKKTIALIIALVLAFSCMAVAFAEGVDKDTVNDADFVDAENPVAEPDDRANPNTGDLIRFVPTVYEVTSEKTVVRGYFVNMNADYAVADFTNFKMNFYDDGDYIVGGSFGTIDSFTLEPKRLEYDAFAFWENTGLKPGTYVCSDRHYCVVTCDFNRISR